MGEKFDEFSKHMAGKHTRRGAFKLLGASIFGAAMTTLTSRNTTAHSPHFNATYPKFNAVFPKFNATFPKFNATPHFNEFPIFNQYADPQEEAVNFLDKILKLFRGY